MNNKGERRSLMSKKYEETVEAEKSSSSNNNTVNNNSASSNNNNSSSRNNNNLMERACSEDRGLRRRPKKESPAWLSWSREQLGETPHFLIGTGSHRSRRIGGRRAQVEAEGEASYVLQSGCFMWTGRAFHPDSYIVQRRERDIATRLSKFIDIEESNQSTPRVLRSNLMSDSKRTTRTSGQFVDEE